MNRIEKRDFAKFPLTYPERIEIAKRYLCSKRIKYHERQDIIQEVLLFLENCPSEANITPSLVCKACGWKLHNLLRDRSKLQHQEFDEWNENTPHHYETRTSDLCDDYIYSLIQIRAFHAKGLSKKEICNIMGLSWDELQLRWRESLNIIKEE